MIVFFLSVCGYTECSGTSKKTNKLFPVSAMVTSLKIRLCVCVCVLQAFQRQVQECLTQLELINKQYRRLARENRTDSSCRLRQMVHDGNQRWDTLQRRVAAILRRLKVTMLNITATCANLSSLKKMKAMFAPHATAYNFTQFKKKSAHKC